MADAFLVGIQQFEAAMTVMVAKADEASRIATAKGIHYIEGKAKKKLGEQSHRKGTATPSQAGQPPAKVSGDLARSFHVRGPVRLGFGEYIAETGPTMVYGRIQELGGEISGAFGGRTVHLPARPYVKPSLDESRAHLASIYSASWAVALR